MRRRMRDAASPFSLALGRTPAAGRRSPQGGGLLSSAFLAFVVHVHGEVGPGQQKANPDLNSGNVSAPHFGGRVVQTRGSDRAHSARRGTLHNTNARSQPLWPAIEDKRSRNSNLVAGTDQITRATRRRTVQRARSRTRAWQPGSRPRPRQAPQHDHTAWPSSCQGAHTRDMHHPRRGQS